MQILMMILLCCVHNFHVQSCHEIEYGISRSQFPDGFLFGTATSSYQIEGAYFEDGKGLSNWDVFSHTPGKIKNGENGDNADDHYHRYLEDIELMSSLGVNVYRFSISWTRILPRGIYGDINPSGIMFYNKIIDNLLLRGIEPFVTIHHYDLPQDLEEIYGGWISPLIQSDFVYFAEICFKSFGDRVKYWTTINEPNMFAYFGYMKGTYPPGHCSPPFGNCYIGDSDVEPLIAMHNMLLSHAKVVELYRKHFQAKQGGTIGIVAFSFMFEPLRDEECDRHSVSRALAFDIAWVLDPLVFGEYPPEMHSILGSKLPAFSPEEKSLIKGSLDFIGINHYGTLYAKDCTLSSCSLEANHPITGFVEKTSTRDGVPIGDPTGIPDFFVVPRGMEMLVDYIKIRYHNLPMYITENGYSSPLKLDVTIHDLLQDFKRIDYHKTYLEALLRSIRKGADIRGYMIWSLLAYQSPLDLKSSYDKFQDQQNTVSSQGTNLYLPPPPPLPLPSQQVNLAVAPVQSAPSPDSKRVSKLQIPTNPRIASNLTYGQPKAEKDSSTTSSAPKPAYIAVSLPKLTEKVSSNDAANSILKPGMFPKSLRGYVERALARCKDDKQMAACQAVMKEMITKATADGTLNTRNWDMEPLFPMPDADVINKDSSMLSAQDSLLPKYKKSPRRSKSRWEPMPEEKPVHNPMLISNDTVKYNSWVPNEKDRKVAVENNKESKEDGLRNTKFSPLLQRLSSKALQRPFKKQRLTDASIASENGDASSDSDKEQSLTAYYSAAMAFSDSPEERKRRENRSKRFDLGQGHRTANNHLRKKQAGAGNMYNRRASALVLSKSFDDGASKAVEDIDWDALTVKGTCQEIEKRYLRLTSAPDPATVRPEEVLEKALLMVQNSQKNYLYKCDQLKSIRQDLTVQRIRNQLTVKVYETHARLALEFGDLFEYNQCQSQLKTLYAEGIEGSDMEFAAYNLLCVIMHSNNNRDLVSSMARLSIKAKKDEAVKHALAVRAAVTSGNYIAFFRLYKAAPNLNTCLMDLYVEKMRYKAVNCMCRSYRPTLPVSYVSQVLGFSTGVAATNGVISDERETDALEECSEWLKAHGASIITDNNGDVLLDTKVSSSNLFVPEPEDAVSHGDANLAVDDFLARAPL